MAMIRTANAVVQHPMVGLDQWNMSRAAALKAGAHGSRVANTMLSQYSPDDYLLTHCTIIASVDVDDAPNVKTGSKVKNADGEEINRPHADYLIKPECSRYINQNGDAWERKLLMATYNTFVGAENYVEHIQVPELSKGKIIDAVARDLGDTVYVDILVATDRKHRDLIARIESGELNTLSMGCTIAYSVCTKCGNVAKDDVELCRHVRYEKGNKFIGPDGAIRVVAELCGHHTDPESVVFIEASWVGNPAFKGAVMRNILEGGPTTHVPGRYDSADLSQRIEHAYTMQSQVIPDWTDMFRKTAAHAAQAAMDQINMQLKLAFDFDDEEENTEEEKSPLEDAVDQFKTKVKDKAMRELRKELRDEKPKKDMPGAEMAPNDSIHHSSMDVHAAYALFTRRYAQDVPDIDTRRRLFALLYTMGTPERYETLRPRFANSEIVTALYMADRENPNRKVREASFYKALVHAGAFKRHADTKTYLKALTASLGRVPTRAEAEQALHAATLLN